MDMWSGTEQVPLMGKTDDVIRVGGTRVTLDTLVAAFNQGATPEEIVCRYPSLHLADVYAVIGYYLHSPSEVETYLRKRRHQAEQVRKRNLAIFDTQGIRKRLLARRITPNK